MNPLNALPALAPAWPLVLMLALALPAVRGVGLALARWAALPALLLAIGAPRAAEPLPGVLLGASVELDDTGRWTLAAVALLWLAGGRVAVGRPHAPRGAPRQAMAALLAMTGALWLPIAGDLPSTLAASVLAGYPLYGLLGRARGGRVLLATVVLADLLILEALWLLAKGAAGLDFAALRAAFWEIPGREVVLALLLVGFGAKAGVMGLHFWLAPVLAEGRAWLMGPVVAFTLAAGLLPWLRLLPLDDPHWPAAAGLLSWVALAGCIWALAAGLLQAAPRAVAAYMLSGLASWWLGVLGLCMGAATSPSDMSRLLPAALALSALGIAALLLGVGAAYRHGRLAGWGLALLAAMLIALAMLGTLWLATAGGDALRWPLVGALACVGILLGASVTAAGTAPGPRRDSEHAAAALLVAGGLVMALLALVSWLDSTPAGGWSGAGLRGSTAALLGGFTVGLVARPALSLMPRVPAGDLLVLLEPAVALLVAASTWLGANLGRLRDRLRAAVEDAARLPTSRQRVVDSAEAWLRRWSTATLLLLAAGAAVALLSLPG
jgi:formate hydrogenlyase subunit 3/multisubunit Na+/H+ antiporter MnhD subunit